MKQDVQFYTGELPQLLAEQKNKYFDTAFVPYLLGIENGIEEKQDIVDFVEQLIKIVPHGHVLITPSRNTKEFRIVGKRYFVTRGYDSIQAIPELQQYIVKEDLQWFETQGLIVLGVNNG